jgi:succinyl-CoA synthetase alpha subunit
LTILLDSDTRVMIQGLTGGQAREHVRYMLAYGTRVVCGVSPGKGGVVVEGVPVYDTVSRALEDHTLDLSVLFIGARRVKEAALEAVEHRVPTILILEDGVPHHDTCEVLTRARANKVRVIGPSAQGMVSPGRAKVGGSGGSWPERIVKPGPVGVISRSGGMGVEISLLLTRHGIGQSTYVAIGGDLMIGSGFADLLPLFQRDEQTRAVVIFGEPGAGHEEAAAACVAEGRFTKPLVAFVAGESLEQMPSGLTFGHTSAIMGGGSGSASAKKACLRRSGARVAERFRDILPLVREALGEHSPHPKSLAGGGQGTADPSPPSDAEGESG